MRSSSLILVSVLLAFLGARPGDAQIVPREQGLSVAVVSRVISAHRRTINGCYTRAARENANTPREIEMRFTIEANGHVAQVQFDPTPTNIGLGMCIRGVLLGLTFPLPAGGASVITTYPFNFER